MPNQNKENQIKDREKRIKLLQENLTSIRKIAGWTTEQLGEKIGVTKQTISNLENGKSTMNFTQYIAIRSVLDCEIEENKENEVLPKVVYLLLDNGDALSDEDYQVIKNNTNTIAATAAGGVAGAALVAVFSNLVLTGFTPTKIALLISKGPLGIIVGAVTGAASAASTLKGNNWLKKLLNKEENDNEENHELQ